MYPDDAGSRFLSNVGKFPPERRRFLSFRPYCMKLCWSLFPWNTLSQADGRLDNIRVVCSSMKSRSQEPIAPFCPEPAESRPSTHTVVLSELLLDFLPDVTCLALLLQCGTACQTPRRPTIVWDNKYGRASFSLPVGLRKTNICIPDVSSKNCFRLYYEYTFSP